MNAFAADFTVTYDPSIMTAVGATLGNVGSSNGGGRTLSVTKTVSRDHNNIAVRPTEFQNAGALVNLNFNVFALPGGVSL